MTNEAKVREVVARAVKDWSEHEFPEETPSMYAFIAAAVCRELCVKDKHFFHAGYCVHCGQPRSKDGDCPLTQRDTDWAELLRRCVLWVRKNYGDEAVERMKRETTEIL